MDAVDFYKNVLKAWGGLICKKNMSNIQFNLCATKSLNYPHNDGHLSKHDNEFSYCIRILFVAYIIHCRLEVEYFKLTIVTIDL